MAQLRELGLTGRRQRRQLRAVRTVHSDQAAVWQALLDRGVLVRDVGLPGWLRVTAGTPAETDAFLPGYRGDHMMLVAAPGRARAPTETKVLVELDLDGTGPARPRHRRRLLRPHAHQLAKHGGFDLTVRTEGDLEIDAHHTVEDTALALGAAFGEALGDKAGVRRFGDALVPMDEVLVQAAVDLSGRPYVVHDEPRRWRRTSAAPARSTRPA